MSLHQPEVLSQLFHNQPILALELLHRLSFDLPGHDSIQIERNALPTEEALSEHQALAISLRSERPTLGIIVDVQLHQETNKRYAWPHYVSGLRARLRCPVVLCVVTPKRSVARWAATPIRLGGRNVFKATVIGPAAIPAVTESALAQELPELAVLSAIAHGRGLDYERAAKIANAAIHASAQLESTRSSLYSDIILNSLSGSARQLLQTMTPTLAPQH
jgi:hypothetical protein